MAVFFSPAVRKVFREPAGEFFPQLIDSSSAADRGKAASWRSFAFEYLAHSWLLLANPAII